MKHPRLTDQQTGRLSAHARHGTALPPEELEAMADQILGQHEPGRRPVREYPLLAARKERPGIMTETPVGSTIDVLQVKPQPPSLVRVPDDWCPDEPEVDEAELQAWLEKCRREREEAMQRGLEKWGPAGPGAHLRR